MSADLLPVIQGLTPLGTVILIILGVLQVARILANARVKTADANLEEARTKLKIAENDGAAAKYQADADARRDIERARIDSAAAVDRDKLAAELEMHRTQQAQAAQQTALVQAQQTAALLTLANVQKQTAATVKNVAAKVEGSEKRLGEKVEGARDDIVAGIEDFRDFSLLYWGMLVEDPIASRERLKRARQAWGAGDMQKMQDVADEDVSAPKEPAPPAEAISSEELSKTP